MAEHSPEDVLSRFSQPGRTPLVEIVVDDFFEWGTGEGNVPCSSHQGASVLPGDGHGLRSVPRLEGVSVASLALGIEVQPPCLSTAVDNNTNVDGDAIHISLLPATGRLIAYVLLEMFAVAGFVLAV